MMNWLKKLETGDKIPDVIRLVTSSVFNTKIKEILDQTLDQVKYVTT